MMAIYNLSAQSSISNKHNAGHSLLCEFFAFLKVCTQPFACVHSPYAKQSKLDYSSFSRHALGSHGTTPATIFGFSVVLVVVSRVPNHILEESVVLLSLIRDDL